jgi:hypothetical protein
MKLCYSYSHRVAWNCLILKYVYVYSLGSCLFILSYLWVGMAIKHIILLFVETPRKFITAKLSIRKPGSSSVLIIICDLFNSSQFNLMFQLKRLVISQKKDFFQILLYLKRTNLSPENVWLIETMFDHNMFSMAGKILWTNTWHSNGKSIVAWHFIGNVMKTPQSIQQKIEY